MNANDVHMLPLHVNMFEAEQKHIPPPNKSLLVVQVFSASLQTHSAQHAAAVVGEHGSLRWSGVPVRAVSTDDTVDLPNETMVMLATRDCASISQDFVSK